MTGFAHPAAAADTWSQLSISETASWHPAAVDISSRPWILATASLHHVAAADGDAAAAAAADGADVVVAAAAAAPSWCRPSSSALAVGKASATPEDGIAWAPRALLHRYPD